MPYSLMSHGRTLGRTGVELPPPGPSLRSWQFLPSPDFAESRSLFAALPAAIEDSQEVIPTQGELEAIPEHEREERVRALMLADPRMARFIELSAQLEALSLALVDDEGHTLPTRALGVTALDIPAEAFHDVLTSVDPAADLGAAREPPYYLVVAGL